MSKVLPAINVSILYKNIRLGNYMFLDIVLAKIFENEIQFGKFPCLGYYNGVFMVFLVIFQ